MITLSIILAWIVFRIFGAYPATSGPASILPILLGTALSLRMTYLLARKGEEWTGCLGAGCLFEYTLIGFFVCTRLSTSTGVILPWAIWTLGVLISQTLVSGCQISDNWLPFQRRWARPGLALFSLALLTMPFLLGFAPFATRFAGTGIEPFFKALLLPLGIAAWTAWTAVVVWRLLVSAPNPSPPP